MSNPPENNSNGLGSSNPLQRLASFKTPRDLTLGAAKPNKKVFTPNLNVSRNKNKASPSTSTKDNKKDKQNHRDKRNDRNRGPRNGPSIIKSSGVFSEGLGSAERHSSRSSYSSRDAEPAAAMQKPTLRIRNFVKADKELEDQKIKQVVGDNSNSGDLAVEDFKQTTEKDAPIRLPMDNGGWANNVSAKTKVKQEVVVKTEPQDDDCAIAPAIEVKPEIKGQVFENTDAVKVLRSEEPTLILLQLPDTLPGRGGSTDDDHPRRNHSSTSANAGENTEKTNTDTKCRLADLEEGKIGKLRVHQSGKVTMLLGDTVFEVSAGTRASFHQELVSVASDDNSRSANLIALGPLHHKLNIVPHWECMFMDMIV